MLSMQELRGLRLGDVDFEGGSGRAESLACWVLWARCLKAWRPGWLSADLVMWSFNDSDSKLLADHNQLFSVQFEATSI